MKVVIVTLPPIDPSSLSEKELLDAVFGNEEERCHCPECDGFLVEIYDEDE